MVTITTNNSINVNASTTFLGQSGWGYRYFLHIQAHKLMRNLPSKPDNISVPRQPGGSSDAYQMLRNAVVILFVSTEIDPNSEVERKTTNNALKSSLLRNEILRRRSRICMN